MKNLIFQAYKAFHPLYTMKKAIIRKKSMAIEDLIPLLFFMVVSVIVLYLFLFSSVIEASEEQQKVRLERDKIELADEFLIYYVTFPVEKEKNIADLIVEAAITKDTFELEEITKQLLIGYFPNQNLAIEIKDHLDEKLLSYPFTLFSFPESNKLGEITLPSPIIDGEINSFKISLYKIPLPTI